MSVYYPSGCDDLLPDHTCDPCAAREGARVRSVAFIHKSYYPTLAADPENSSVWSTGIAAASIIIIPATQGSIEPTDNMGTGYGDTEEEYLSTSFTLTIKDPNYIGNADFYNPLKRNRNFHVAYRTETQTHISDKPCTIVGRAPIADDLNTDVVWEVVAKWNSQDSPVPFNTPAGVFECVNLS